ncbi:hypothetical protein [Aquimarina litoralis]|uniref:hypothetical protein n=1 Tax=Aquimarina litoralis TaxID=584605 RepID=UPI001C58D7AA|nr:hypothetical protein [Aquimarina litoralis]MBW1298772.1 hypothetical protein [Aquimarina litoralis]
MSKYQIILFKIVKLLIIIVIVDMTLGIAAQKLFYTQKTGKYARSTYAIDKTDAEILVFGSSHAHRHYVPEVLENKLHSSVYNAGAEGQQLLYHLGLQKMILKRIKPKTIILNIDEDFLFQSNIAYDRLHDLYPYYVTHKDVLRPIFAVNNRFVDIKMLFKSYLFNSTIIHMTRYYVSPQIDHKGYRPLHGTVNKNYKDLNPYSVDQKNTIDNNLVLALEEFILNAKSNNIQLVFVTSPKLIKTNYQNNKSFHLINQMANAQNIPVLNFFNDDRFINNFELFHDPSHLNDKGASYFTELVSDKILLLKK